MHNMSDDLRDTIVNLAAAAFGVLMLSIMLAVNVKAEGLFVAPPAGPVAVPAEKNKRCHIEFSAAGTFLSARDETLAEGSIVPDPFEIVPGVGIGLIEDVKIEGKREERKLTGGVGLGCDVQLNSLFFVGGGLRADFGSDINHGSLVGRVGVLVNALMDVYGTVSWQVKDWELGDNGALFLGAGASVALGDADRYRAFVEFSHAVSKFGNDGFLVDDQQLRAGLRIKLGE